MKLLVITQDLLDHEGVYVGPEDVKDWPGDIEIASDLGVIVFRDGLSAQGELKAGPGSGIHVQSADLSVGGALTSAGRVEVDHNLKVGGGVTSGGRIEVGGEIVVGGALFAEDEIRAKLDIFAGDAIEAGEQIISEEGRIEAGRNIACGSDVWAAKTLKSRGAISAMGTIYAERIGAMEGILSMGDMAAEERIWCNGRLFSAGDIAGGKEGVRAGKGIEAGGRLLCKGSIETVKGSISAKAEIWTPGLLAAPGGISAGKHLSGGTVVSGGDLRAAHYIAGQTIYCGQRIFAGLESLRTRDLTNREIRGVIEKGEIRAGVNVALDQPPAFAPEAKAQAAPPDEPRFQSEYQSPSFP